MIFLILLTCSQAASVFQMTDVKSLLRPVPPEELGETVAYTEKAAIVNSMEIDLPDFVLNYDALRNATFEVKSFAADRRVYFTKRTWTQTIIVTCYLIGSIILLGLIAQMILKKGKGKSIKVTS